MEPATLTPLEGALNIQELIAGAFSQEELDFLNAQPRFTEAVARIQTEDDFEALCVLADLLLFQDEQARLRLGDISPLRQTRPPPRERL